MTPRRAKKDALLRELQARKGFPEYNLILELLDVMLDESKNALVTCEPNDFRLKQGEARAYEGLIRAITRPAPPQQTTET